MKKANYLLLSILLLGTMETGQAQSRARIDGYLDLVHEQHVIPGFSVVVVKGKQIVYAKGFGKERLGSSKNFTANTVSAIGSLTKSITALAVMQLVDQGLLRLDTPVVHYLPWFRTANKDMSDKVTVRMLLNNTAGLRAEPDLSYDLSDRALEHLAKSVQSFFITREPGTSYEYSNVGFGIAGLLVHKVSGLSYLDYIETHIFGPLQMRSTTSDPSRFSEIGAIEGHYPGKEKAIPALREPQTESGEFVPAGSFARSTANDLGKYLIALLNRGTYNSREILSAESVERMWQPNVVFPGLSEEEGGDAREFQYGLGWMISDIDGRRIVHHGGSTGKMSSFTMIDAENDVAVSMLANVDLTFIDQYQYPTIFNLVNNVLHLASGTPTTTYGIPNVPDPSKNDFQLPDGASEKYIGEYGQDGGGDNWVNFGLHLSLRRNEKGILEASVARGEQEVNRFTVDFVNEAQAMSRNMAAPQRMVFKLAPNGHVTGLYMSGIAYNRESGQLRETHRETAGSNGARFLLPKDWDIHWTREGFSANKRGVPKICLTGSFKEGKIKTIDSYIQAHFPDSPLVHRGALTNHHEGGLVWRKQSFALKEHARELGALTVFYGRKGPNQLFLAFRGPAAGHTLGLQEVVAPILKSFRFRGD